MRRQSAAGLRYLLVIALCGATLVLSLFPPYQPTGTELLDNGDFSRGLTGWLVKAEAASVDVTGQQLTITHPVVSRHSEVVQCFETRTLPPRILLQARAASESVRVGPRAWNLAKMGFVAYDAQGNGLYQVSTQLMGLAESHDWRQYQKVYEVQQSAPFHCVEIALYAAPGRFLVRDVSLRGVTRQASVGQCSPSCSR